MPVLLHGNVFSLVRNVSWYPSRVSFMGSQGHFYYVRGFIGVVTRGVDVCAGTSFIPCQKIKKNRACRLHGANNVVHLDRAANSAAAGHHLALPLHQPPPRVTSWPPPRTTLAPTTTSCHPCAGHHLVPPLRKSLKETIKEVVHIVPVGGEVEESSWYLEPGKEGECSCPLLLTR
jgi:hypothetical protein